MEDKSKEESTLVRRNRITNAVLPNAFVPLILSWPRLAFGLRITDAFAPPREIIDTLKATDKSLLPPLSPEESYVKINDRVVEISGD